MKLYRVFTYSRFTDGMAQKTKAPYKCANAHHCLIKRKPQVAFEIT